MRVFLVFALCLITTQALTPEQTAKLDKISKECRQLSGVSEDTVLRARQGDIDDDPKLKKQIFCVAKKVGLITQADEVDVDAYKARIRKASISDEEAEKITKKCLVKKETPEETEFAIFKCIFKDAPNLVIVD